MRISLTLWDWLCKTQFEFSSRRAKCLQKEGGETQALHEERHRCLDFCHVCEDYFIHFLNGAQSSSQSPAAHSLKAKSLWCIQLHLRAARAAHSQAVQCEVPLLWKKSSTFTADPVNTLSLLHWQLHNKSDLFMWLHKKQLIQEMVLSDHISSASLSVNVKWDMF